MAEEYFNKTSRGISELSDEKDPILAKTFEQEYQEQDASVRFIEQELVVAETHLHQQTSWIEHLRVTLAHCANEKDRQEISALLTRRITDRRDLERTVHEIRTRCTLAKDRLRAFESIFDESDPVRTETLKMPPAFIHAKAEFFQNVRAATPENPFLRLDWLAEPVLRQEIAHFIAYETPHRVAIQEEVIQEYLAAHPNWNEEEVFAFARRVLPTHLAEIAKRVFVTAAELERTQKDPSELHELLGVAYNQSMNLFCDSLEQRARDAKEGIGFLPSLQDLQSNPLFPRLLRLHTRHEGPATSRARLQAALNTLIDAIVTRDQVGVESSEQKERVTRFAEKVRQRFQNSSEETTPRI